MSDTNDIEDFLSHFGVKGMHWGKHTASPDSGSSGGGKSRADLKALDKAAKSENKATKVQQRAESKAAFQKLVDNEQRKIDKNDNAIYKARQDRGKFRQNVKEAKKTYNVQKHEIGKVAAKRALTKAKDEKYANFQKSIQETSREESARIMREAGQQLMRDLQVARFS